MLTSQYLTIIGLLWLIIAKMDKGANTWITEASFIISILLLCSGLIMALLGK